MADLIFEVPPGLGDISWCYEKILDLVGARKIGFKICNDKPLRSLDFVDLLQGVENLGYGRSYNDTKKVLIPYTTDLASLPDGTYAISMNPHLESGNRIEKAFPLQTTHYHYWDRLNTNFEQRYRAENIVKVAANNGEPVIGFYCSSNSHRPNVSFWNIDEWVQFLTMVATVVKNVRFIAIGARYDDKTFDVYRAMAMRGFNVTSALGTFDCGTTISLLKKIDYFVAFPSGLAILADVVNTPCMMFYWSNVIREFAKFPNSYADPEHVANGFHLNLPYIKPNEAFRHFTERGRPHLAANTAWEI